MQIDSTSGAVAHHQQQRPGWPAGRARCRRAAVARRNQRQGVGHGRARSHHHVRMVPGDLRGHARRRRHDAPRSTSPRRAHVELAADGTRRQSRGVEPRRQRPPPAASDAHVHDLHARRARRDTTAGTRARRNPTRAASASRRGAWGTCRISPPRPTSPNTTTSAGRAARPPPRPAPGPAPGRRRARAPGCRPRPRRRRRCAPATRPARCSSTASSSASRPPSTPWAERRLGVSRRGARRQGLDLDQQGPLALHGRQHGAARRPGPAVAEQQPVGVGHRRQAGVAHLEEAELAGGAEAVLGGAHRAQGVVAVPLDTGARCRPGARGCAGPARAPSLVTWPTSTKGTRCALARWTTTSVQARTWPTLPGRARHAPGRRRPGWSRRRPGPGACSSQGAGHGADRSVAVEDHERRAAAARGARPVDAPGGPTPRPTRAAPGRRCRPSTTAPGAAASTCPRRARRRAGSPSPGRARRRGPGRARPGRWGRARPPRGRRRRAPRRRRRRRRRRAATATSDAGGEPAPSPGRRARRRRRTPRRGCSTRRSPGSARPSAASSPPHAVQRCTVRSRPTDAAGVRTRV